MKNDNKTNINCEKPIYRKFLRTIDKTGFLMLRFLHFLIRIIESKQKNFNRIITK